MPSRTKKQKGGAADDRFATDEFFTDSPEAGPSVPRSAVERANSEDDENHMEGEEAHDEGSEDSEAEESGDETSIDGLNPEGFAGPSEKVVKPLTPEALAAYRAAQERTGVVYISRIPPGMRPTKVRHLMSQYGDIGRVYLQQEGELNPHSVSMCTEQLDQDRLTDPKRAFLRKKFTSTKKPHFAEGWVEFKDKKVARSVATMLNAQPIGGKKGTRWRDDVWTMKYLPKFKWHMLTEQIGEQT